MKTKTLLSIAMVMIMLGAFAQKPSMTLTFTADNNGQHVPMNSILIENLTQGGDTTLYAPDTVLVLNYALGIGEDQTIGGNVFRLFQNYPNPMKGQTTVSLYLPEKQNVLITISDIVGRNIFSREYPLDDGNHSFTFYPGRESLYFLTAFAHQQSRTIKMFNSPYNANVSGYCKLEYNGEQKTGVEEYKSGNSLNNFVFNQGDQLKFTASTGLGDRVITSAPTGDQTYYFHYTGDPCPDMPTVTDIDGNVYNTVLIGEQCWMKENLKTTQYRNSTPIEYPGTDNSAWQNNTTGAYAWFGNDINWKDSYGALYNWHAVNNTNGLCPAGWHAPTNNEWTVLTDYIGGTGSPHGNELKSCRQVNSPLGGNCNTSEHPRWHEHSTHYGTDDYGFSGLPGGNRSFQGFFYFIGNYGHWWSSTENSSDFAWYRFLYYDYGSVNVHYLYKHYGFSIRCLRDNQTAPISDFSAIPTGGLAPLIVNFTDESLNSPSTWQWDFGDGNSSTQQNPVHTYQNAGSYTVQLTVTNSYGSDTEIKTNYITVTSGGGTGVPCPGVPTVTYEGQVYNTVFIGSQCWLKENLNVGTMVNGSQNQTNNGTIEKYCYNNNTANCDIYGGLYQWNEMMGYSTTPGVQGICPPGWHIPTDDEWKILEGSVDSLYGVGDPIWNSTGWRGFDAGKNLKSSTGWISGGNGTDLYGFGALPGGNRYTNGSFYNLGNFGLWWSSSEDSGTYAWYRYLYYDFDGSIRNYSYMSIGRSVRCLKDN
jgi:uncharacterized protein (TIGR02145 family)